VARLILEGQARGERVDDLATQLRSFAGRPFPFPGDVFTEIASAALERAGATPATPLSCAQTQRSVASICEQIATRPGTPFDTRGP
jgi:hypothetical protein